VSGIEGIGEVVTGAMAARAVEPEAGERSTQSGGACLNCGAALDGAYCRQCGQKAEVHRSVRTIMHDLVHGVLHLDGKLWRTLPLLAWRPGELTRRYVHGERAKFVSPMAMFLFSVFLMFAVLTIYGVSLTSLDFREGEMGKQVMSGARQELAQELRTAHDRRAAFARGERVLTKEGRPATAEALEREVAGAQERASAVEELSTGTGRFQIVAPELGQTGWRRFDEGIAKLNENPGLALYKLQANGYKFSWLLIPLSVPFVWLLFFWTRRFHFYDHTVFVTYSLSFMSLFAIVLMVLGFAGLPSAAIGMAAVLVPPIHMFRQLKQAYRLHWASALLRTIILTLFCAITATLFFVLLLGIGALG
jgi:Protein of unknown function (DUF3667)